MTVAHWFGLIVLVGGAWLLLRAVASITEDKEDLWPW